MHSPLPPWSGGPSASLQHGVSPHPGGLATPSRDAQSRRDSLGSSAASGNGRAVAESDGPTVCSYLGIVNTGTVGCSRPECIMV